MDLTLARYSSGAVYYIRILRHRPNEYRGLPHLPPAGGEEAGKGNGEQETGGPNMRNVSAYNPSNQRYHASDLYVPPPGNWLSPATQLPSNLGSDRPDPGVQPDSNSSLNDCEMHETGPEKGGPFTPMIPIEGTNRDFDAYTPPPSHPRHLAVQRPPTAGLSSRDSRYPDRGGAGGARGEGENNPDIRPVDANALDDQRNEDINQIALSPANPRRLPVQRGPRQTTRRPSRLDSEDPGTVRGGGARVVGPEDPDRMPVAANDPGDQRYNEATHPYSLMSLADVRSLIAQSPPTKGPSRRDSGDSYVEKSKRGDSGYGSNSGRPEAVVRDRKTGGRNQGGKNIPVTGEQGHNRPISPNMLQHGDITLYPPTNRPNRSGSGNTRSPIQGVDEYGFNGVTPEPAGDGRGSSSSVRGTEGGDQNSRPVASDDANAHRGRNGAVHPNVSPSGSLRTFDVKSPPVSSILRANLPSSALYPTVVADQQGYVPLLFTQSPPYKVIAKVLGLSSVLLVGLYDLIFDNMS